ncbi:MAG: ATP-binding protein [Nitrospirota bacterium]|nr:ATP-binding protein [Nitrospirota bacterium]
MGERVLLWRVFIPGVTILTGALLLLCLYGLSLLGGEAGTAQRGDLLIATLFTALGAGLVLYNVARGLATPFEEAAEAAERLAAGESGHRMPSHAEGELASIAEAINLLARTRESGASAGERREQEHLAILSVMSDGVVAVDAGGRIITLNPAAAGFLKLARADAPGRRLAELVRNPDLLRFADQVRAEGGTGETEVSLSGARGELRLRVTAAPLPRGKGRPGSVLVFTDITRIHQLERMRRDFVANVSHELKTPITAIQGAVETLRDGAADDREARDRFFDMLHRQSERLGALVSDTLSLSRIERDVDKGGMTLSPTRLRKVLDEAMEDCRPKADEKGTPVTVECPDDLQVSADAAMLEQAVVNLALNAITYSPPGTPVAVRVLPGSDIVIEVADSGPGIAPEHLPRLFERFYRVDAGRSRDLGGTGLGLAIVKHVALAHGGRVSVDSKPGKGSTFRIHLPTA